MNKFVKPIALMGLAGVLAVGALAPQAEARNGRWVAAGAGFAAGALIGAAAANASYYNNGYYYGGPGYAYAPAYDSYAYQPTYPAPVYGGYHYRDYGWNAGVNRRNDSYAIKERHLNGTE
ncbi:MAG: hypothetical protein AB1490_13845 [Pseudomonadota bacterium]